MHDSPEPKRCPDCGSAVPEGTGVLFCPVCVLTEDETQELPEETDGQRMGSYTLLEEIARGGMGVVYRARQSGLNRIVALKVLPGAAFASDSFRARFQREAETAARLNHPGIVAVHEVGQALGQPFLSMDFIDGPSLATRLAQLRMTPEFAAQILREVARAVSHAHLHGVAHRDLKPSNILLTSDNQPVLTDFGLACFLDLDSLEGLTLDVMGSPPYLPPERLASGKSSDPVMEDVYGLGAVLYHCLTGRPPFMADSLNALLAAVGESEAVAPRRLNHSVPVDLETICLKCLEKSPAARYPCAAAVADELDRFLRGEPILARPLSPANRIIKLMRRKPLASSLIFALAVTMLAGAVVSTVAWRSAASNAADFRAVAEKRRVDLYSANLSAASAARESGNRNQARELLSRCRPAAGETDLRGCEWSVMHQLLQSRELFSLKAHDHILTALAWHPGGDTLLSGGYDGSLKSWQRTKDHPLLEKQTILAPGNPRIQQIQYLPDGSAFLVAEGEMIRCRKPGDGTLLWEIPGTRFSLAADGTTLAVTTAGMFFFEPSGRISLWKIPTDSAHKPKLLKTFPFSARAVAISPDGRWLAASLPKHTHHDEERDLDLIDLNNPTAAPRLLETSGSVLTLAFSPDSSRLVATTQAAKPATHCFDMASGLEVPLPVKINSCVRSVCFAADSRKLLVASSDRALRLLSVDEDLSQTLPLAHDNEIWAAALHPSGTEVASGDKDGILKIHPMPLPQAPLAAFPRHPHFRYSSTVFSADSSLLHVCETSPVWKTSAWNPKTSAIQATPFTFYPEAIDPAGNAVCRDTEKRQVILISPSSPPTAIPFPPASWPETPSMHNHGASLDRRHIYQFSETGHAATFNLATREIRTLENFCQAPPTASALSPGGRFLVAANWHELIIHDFTTGKTSRQSNDPHWAKTIAFSPDGSLMASGGTDSHIQLRRTTDFTLIGKLSGHLSEVSGLTISPDGLTLVSSEIGSGLRFWRLDTLREVMSLPLPEVCESLVFSPDGQSLAIITCPPASAPTAGQVMVIPCPREEAKRD